MKSEFDKEMDTLLRRGLQAAARTGSDTRAEEAAGAAHLDADELSAYAANALPAPTRMRYTAHLADCSRCRKIVSAISLASNVSGELEKEVAAAPAVAAPVSGWRAWLGTFISPRALNYALPLLALCIIGVIAFIAIRGAREDSLTAQREDSQANRQVGITSDTTATTAPTDTTATMNANSTAGDAQNARPVEQNAPEQEASKEAAPLQGSGVGTTAEPVDKVARRETAQTAPAVNNSTATSGTGTSSNGPVAAAPASVEVTQQPPPPAPKAAERAENNRAASVAGNDRSADEETSEVARGETRNKEKQRAPDGSRNDSRSAESRARAQDSLTMSAPAKGESERAPAREAKRRRSDELAAGRARGGAASAGSVFETRSAAGHKFRREGSAWVDVNFASGMDITRSVRRGTEQYRALVADLPALESIANQLPGEVIAVVGGRAYRIR